VSRARLWSRGVLAGPVVFACAALLMCGGALWVPGGAARIDNLVLPMVLFPAIWATLFFYACLDRRLDRAWAVVSALSLLHAAAIAWQLIGASA